MNGDPDVCEKNPDRATLDQKAMLDMLAFPMPECPVAEGRRCMDGSKKRNISKYKGLLPMAAGKLTANYNIIHDTVISLLISFFSARVVSARDHLGGILVYIWRSWYVFKYLLNEPELKQILCHELGFDRY